MKDREERMNEVQRGKEKIIHRGLKRMNYRDEKNEMRRARERMTYSGKIKNKAQREKKE